MELLNKSTNYIYVMTMSEKLILTGILSLLSEHGELKLEDEQSREQLERLLKGISQ